MPTRPTRSADQAPTNAAPAEEAPQPPKSRRGPRAGTESARRGGMAVREKYGQAYFAQIGSRGGKSASAQHGSDFYAGIGHVGGSKTRDRLGIAHYERIGRMGGLRQRQRERSAAEQPQQPGQG